MTKILITGATDGIGRAATTRLLSEGHALLIHGRSAEKLAQTAQEVGLPQSACFRADLSDMDQVTRLAVDVADQHGDLAVLVNNAGVFKTSEPRTPQGDDIRFVVNTFAPFALTNNLRRAGVPLSWVVNLSSAAQAPVDLMAMAGQRRLGDMEAYAQSKLALTMWSMEPDPDGLMVVAVNPGSLLASKMVREGFGVAGNDIAIGADIVARAATSPEFAQAHAQYFDNDAGAFGPAHPDAHNAQLRQQVIDVIRQEADRLTAGA